MTDFKFNEDKYIKEIYKYIESTYSGHYSGSKFQTTEVMIDRGRGEGFLMGNIDKYSLRYGMKGSKEDHRKDLLKILHYAILMLYVHDSENGEVNDEDQ